MIALRAHRRGGPGELVVEHAPVPIPAAGEVFVAVHAGAITFDELTWEETWTPDGRHGNVLRRLPAGKHSKAVGDQAGARGRACDDAQAT